jgi:ribosomal protein S1
MLEELSREFPNARISLQWSDGTYTGANAADAHGIIAQSGKGLREIRFNNASFEYLCDALGEFCWETLGGIEEDVTAERVSEEISVETTHGAFRELQPGEPFHGKVKKIVEFGAFVEKDGLVGLLHISKMAAGRVEHPSEVLTEGQAIECIILELDREKSRITLGLKERLVSPWESVRTRYSTGARARGKVAHVAPYGAFVELEPGVQGLLHVSEVSWPRPIQNASELFSKGQVIDVVVLSINEKERKISLGMCQLV